MLYIKKGQKSRLPKKYHRINNLCAIIYDQLNEIIATFEEDHLRTRHIEINKEADKLIQELEDGSLDILDWLKHNNRKGELTEILTTHLTLSILADLINFVYESLLNAQKGKLSVAYALCRKPFTDELLLLEQLLINKTDFVERFFYDGEPSSYDPATRERKKREYLEPIISSANDSLPHKLPFSADFIYDLRYNKEFNGINGLSNKALHIVTSSNGYRTENQNLNFVFLNKNVQNGLWRHYYQIIPYLLLYTTAVVDGIVFKQLPDDYNYRRSLKAFQRMVGFILITDEQSKGLRKSNTKLLNSIKRVLKFSCPNCHDSNHLSRPDLDLFIETQLILCKTCFSDLIPDMQAFAPIDEFLNLIQNYQDFEIYPEKCN